MKNSEICRAAMPFIRSPVNGDMTQFAGMCAAIWYVTNSWTCAPLEIVLKDFNERAYAESYFYPCPSGGSWSLRRREQGYTSRIIFLELAALLWEDEGN